MSSRTSCAESIALRKYAAPPAALLRTTTGATPFAVLSLPARCTSDKGEQGCRDVSCALPGAGGGNGGAACVGSFAVCCSEMFTKNALAVTIVFVRLNSLFSVLVD